MLFCIEIEQSNMGCNEIKSRIVAKLSSLPWREQSSKEDEVKKKKKKKKKKIVEKDRNMILHLKETVIRVSNKAIYF